MNTKLKTNLPLTQGHIDFSFGVSILLHSLHLSLVMVITVLVGEISVACDTSNDISLGTWWFSKTGRTSRRALPVVARTCIALVAIVAVITGVKECRDRSDDIIVVVMQVQVQFSVCLRHIVTRAREKSAIATVTIEDHNLIVWHDSLKFDKFVHTARTIVIAKS